MIRHMLCALAPRFCSCSLHRVHCRACGLHLQHFLTAARGVIPLPPPPTSAHPYHLTPLVPPALFNVNKVSWSEWAVGRVWVGGCGSGATPVCRACFALGHAGAQAAHTPHATHAASSLGAESPTTVIAPPCPTPCVWCPALREHEGACVCTKVHVCARRCMCVHEGACVCTKVQVCAFVFAPRADP